MGRYVPPDQEGLTSGNKLHNKHALGARASQASKGILTVRFEMPFAVWCAHCPKPTIVGQGVRFNAQKQKVGAYYSSPVYGFRMKHAACGGDIEIRTDPANTAYVVHSGGTRRDTGDDKTAVESLVGGGVPAIVTLKEQAEQRDSAFSNLEKTIADREVFEAAKLRIAEIEDANAQVWDDPYTKNQSLRKAFRVGRKAREKDAAATEDLQDRMSLGIELLPETEEDARWAKLIDFGSKMTTEDQGPEKVLAKPLFSSESKAAVTKKTVEKKPDAKKPTRKLKSEVAASKMRESLVSEIVENTRMVTDPFLEPKSKGSSAKSVPTIPGLKRKRSSEKEPPDSSCEKEAPEKTTASATTATPASLVDYDSD